MEEIKSSFNGVNKIIEDYNSKIYVASFLSSVNGEDNWKSAVFNTKIKALHYLINNIESIFNDLINGKIIDNLADSEKDYLCDIEKENFNPHKDGYLFYDGWSYDKKFIIKDIDNIMDCINSISSCHGILYYHNIKECEIE